MTTLLYLGAGWDFEPLRMEKFKNVTTFLLYDALPAKKHYEPQHAGFKDQENFFETLNREVHSFCGLELKKGEKLPEIHNEEAKMIEWKISQPKVAGYARRQPEVAGYARREKRVIYHYSVDCEKIIFPPADILFIRGYCPEKSINVSGFQYVYLACDTCFTDLCITNTGNVCVSSICVVKNLLSLAGVPDKEQYCMWCDRDEDYSEEESSEEESDDSELDSP